MNKRWKRTLIVSVFIVAVFLVSMIGFKLNIQKQLQNQQKLLLFYENSTHLHSLL